MPKAAFQKASADEFNFDSSARTWLGALDVVTIDAYLGLKSMFGEPDRQNIDPTKGQWAFFLKTEGALIEVYDRRFETCYVAVYRSDQNEPRAKRLASELERQIANAASRHRGLVANLAKNPAGHAIENPFELHYQTAKLLTSMAKAQLPQPKSQTSAEGAATEAVDKGALCRAALFQLMAAIEGLLNLLYEVYLKVELREDRIKERLMREQVDVKLRLAPVYCDCFLSNVFDHTTEPFHNFQRLINARNDFIRANITKAMKTIVLDYDGMTFVQLADESEDALAGGSMSQVGIDEVEHTMRLVEGIISQILASMKPRNRREFAAVIHDELIRIEYEDRVPVILL